MIKHQAPEKLQEPNIKHRNVVLVFGNWSFSGAWRLVLGIFAMARMRTLNATRLVRPPGSRQFFSR
jgi:hypothetical protein